MIHPSGSMPSSPYDVSLCCNEHTMGGNDPQDAVTDAIAEYERARTDLHGTLKAHIDHLSGLLDRIEAGQTYATYSEFEVADLRHRRGGFKALLAKAEKLDSCHKAVKDALENLLG